MNTNRAIMIIDDDKFLLDMYAIKFKESGFSVTPAFDGRDALGKLERKEVAPNIILLDLVMPGVDGFDVLKQIKEKNLAPEAAVIVLSNLGEQEDINKCLTLGAVGFVVKASATPSEVVKKVLAIVDKK